MTDLTKTAAPTSLLVAGATIVVLVLAMTGCLPQRGQMPESRRNNEDGIPTRDIVEEITIPALDAAAPTQTETATFALG